MNLMNGAGMNIIYESMYERMTKRVVTMEVNYRLVLCTCGAEYSEKLGRCPQCMNSTTNGIRFR